MAGDNLGSHGIGEFSENFTSCNFCRCEVTRDELKKEPNLCGRQQTADSYDAADAALSEEKKDINNVIIQEYPLDSRTCLFPHSTLKPKHHYMRHYPSLILKFGPLIQLWTRPGN